MLVFCLKYRKSIDVLTADKSLSMRAYDLDLQEWDIVKELVSILEVK